MNDRNQFKHMSTRILDNRLANEETNKKDRKEILSILKSRGIKKGDIVMPKNSEFNPYKKNAKTGKKGVYEKRYAEVTEVHDNKVKSVDFGGKNKENSGVCWINKFGNKRRDKRLTQKISKKIRTKKSLDIKGRKVTSPKDKKEYITKEHRKKAE